MYLTKIIVALALIALFARTARAQTQANVCCPVDQEESSYTCVPMGQCQHMSSQTVIAECATTSGLGELCSNEEPPMPCNDEPPNDCATCLNGVWVEDPAKLDPCGKCDSRCKVLAQNIALVDGASLTVGNQNIIDLIEELRQRCEMIQPVQ